LLGALALPAAAALVADGGFFPRGQVAFAVVSAGAALGVIVVAGFPSRAISQPAVIALLGLAALSALSAAWTIAAPVDALRWGAVVGAYTLIAIAAAAVARRLGAPPVAVLIAALASIAGLIGLYGAGARVEPLAQRLGGQWSPGGPFEYSPALALAEISAVPVLLAAMVRSVNARFAALAAAGAAVAGSAVALAGSRVELVLGALVLVACVLGARRALSVRPATVLAAAALTIAAGGFADAVAGSYAQPYQLGGDAPRLLGLAAIVVGAGALWLAQRRAIWAATTPWRLRAAVALVAIPLAGGLTAAAVTPDTGPRAEPVSGFAHGRIALWESAVDVAADRPLAGAGSLAFLRASRADQSPPPVRFAHDLPLESWAELGVAGLALALLLCAGSAWLVWSRWPGVAAWLLGPAILAFLAANLFDWPWHVPASGALFALALGGLIGAGRPTCGRP
jgi:O-antigen ligase/polysaccharide polymerase Wzy-like membrane protein